MFAGVALALWFTSRFAEDSAAKAEESLEISVLPEEILLRYPDRVRRGLYRVEASKEKEILSGEGLSVFIWETREGNRLPILHPREEGGERESIGGEEQEILVRWTGEALLWEKLVQ